MASTPARYLPEPSREKLVEARKLWEGKPYSDFNSVAAEAGVLPYWVRRWKREGGWAKASQAVPGFSGMVAAAADNMKVRMSELGKPLDDGVATQEAAKEAALEFAVDVRAQVLDRHRREWSAPRKIAYDAIQQSGKGDVAGAFERAKLAKISAETLTLIQSGECRAFGINHETRAADSQTVVVVERGGGEPAVSATPGTGTGDEGEF